MKSQRTKSLGLPINCYVQCMWETNYIMNTDIHKGYKRHHLICSPDVILLFVLTKYAKMSYFSPWIILLSQAFKWKNLEVIHMKNIEVFQKGV